jgi:sigma-E factor negative regulatory protein RseC
MIEESGVVVAVEGEYAWVETQAKSACGHCDVGGSCGTSVLAKIFANKRNRVQVQNHLGLQQGDGAVIGISDEMLTRAALMAYMLPLVFMLVVAMMVSGMGANNAIVALSSGLGLLGGLLLMRWLNQYIGKGTVSLVRRAMPVNCIPLEIDMTERG